MEDENVRLSVDKTSRLLIDSRIYHNLGRALDDYFKVLYPLISIIFLFIYVFIIIEGDENKCIN